MNISDEKSQGREERMTSLGAFLRERREKRGMSIREVARRAGVSHTSLVRTERGEQSPSSVEQLVAYTHALELTREDTDLAFELAGYRLEQTAPPTTESNVWRDFDFLTALYQDAEHSLANGDFQKSRLYFTKIAEALRGNEEKEFSDLQAKANLQLSKILNLQDEPGAALKASHEAQKIARTTNNLPLDLEATHTLGVVLHKVKLDENAVRCYGWVLNRMDRRKYPEAERALVFRDVATAMINLREFDEVQEIARDGIKIFEKADKSKELVNLREIYGRSLATQFRVPEAEKEIESLWNWAQTLDVTPLERIRILVILFKVNGLKGNIDQTHYYHGEILKLVNAHGLFGELRCLESIAKEVAVFRGDVRWLKWLFPKNGRMTHSRN